ncbi:hypothetical protein CK203_105145 [Vitis vinifera]|uniref:Reverse transcriptase Ty1/copia-type domain-containing protein n=1 Tax=Vitis vinifera TaxID=29760 RepID=A0A438EDG7_VITVI|nr:hypothetical protein CK203_105145 [Vitis vinifera]
MAAKFESEGRRDEKPTRLFQQGYTRKNKDAIVIPLSSSNTPLNDTTKASDDSCNTDPKMRCKWIALRGLHQKEARLSYSIKEYGFKQVMADRTLFYERDGDDITLLIVYVDDMIVTVNIILAYMKSSPSKHIMFSRHGHLDIESYIDSDFAGSILDRKPTSRYVSFVGGNLVTSRTIEIINNSVQHNQTKHIELDRNYIKDNLDSSIIKVPYIKSANQLTDVMTHVVTNKVQLYQVQLYHPPFKD